MGPTEILTLIGIVAGSQGFWMLIGKISDKQSDGVKLLKGLAHDVIITKGLTFIDQGYVTKDEYDDYIKYLYDPYQKLGGNGLAERVHDEVVRLPIKSKVITRDIPIVEKDEK